MNYFKLQSSLALDRLTLAVSLTVCLCGILMVVIVQKFTYFYPLYSLFSACLFVYYARGASRVEQTLEVMLGIFISILAVFPVILFVSNPVLSGLYLILITFVLYYLSALNELFVFIAKISLTILPFVIFSQTPLEADRLFYSLCVGSALAIFGTIIRLYFIEYLTSRICYEDWLAYYIKILTRMARGERFKHSEKLRSVTLHVSKILREHDMNLSILPESMTQILLNISKQGQTQSGQIVCKLFSDSIQMSFTSVIQALKSNNLDSLLAIREKLRQDLTRVREKNYFSQLSVEVRDDAIYLFYLLNTMLRNTAYLVKNKPQLCNLKTPSKNIQWPDFNKLRPFTTDKELNNCVKVALRTVIAISISYVAAIVFKLEYSAWVVMTTNLVCFIRQKMVITRAWDRLAGHVIGFVLALLISILIWPYFSSAYFWFPLLLFIASFAFLRNYFYYSIIIMLMLLYIQLYLNHFQLDLNQTLYFLSWRMLDTLIGVVIGLSAGLLIFPLAGNSPLKPMLVESFTVLSHHINSMCQLLQNNTDNRVELITHQQYLLSVFKANNDEFNMLRYNPNFHSNTYQLFSEFVTRQSFLIEKLLSVSRVVYMINMTGLPNRLINQHIESYFIQLLKALKQIIESINNLSEINYPLNKRKAILQEAHMAVIDLMDDQTVPIEELIHYIGLIRMLMEFDQVLSEINLL